MYTLVAWLGLEEDSGLIGGGVVLSFKLHAAVLLFVLNLNASARLQEVQFDLLLIHYKDKNDIL